MTRLLPSLLALSAAACTIVYDPDDVPRPPTQESLLAESTFAVKLQLPGSATWDVGAIAAHPALPGAHLEGSHAVLDWTELAAFQLGTATVVKALVVPSEIGLQVTVGADRTIWVFTDAPAPDVYLALYGFPTTLNHAPGFLRPPPSFGISPQDEQAIVDRGIPLGTGWSDKHLFLSQLALSVYRQLRAFALVPDPLSDVDLYDLGEVTVLNQSGRGVAILAALNLADCLATGGSVADLATGAWWPPWPDTRCGTAEWGFDLSLPAGGGPWYAAVHVSGDNGTVQTLAFDGSTYLQHADYGADGRFDTTATAALPASVVLRHDDVWSGNSITLSMVVQTDVVVVSNLWEDPAVGSPPAPLIRYLDSGWNAPVP